MRIDVKLLKKALAMSKRIAVAKSVYPILSNVKITQAPDGEITLTATDLDVWAHYALGTGETQSLTTSLHVDPRKLSRLLTACKIPKGGTVELTTGEKEMFVEIGERMFQLLVTDSKDWPDQPVLSGEVASVRVDDVEPLKYAARAMSQDVTRYNMRGVYFDSNCLVATDTHTFLFVWITLR